MSATNQFTPLRAGLEIAKDSSSHHELAGKDVGSGDIITSNGVIKDEEYRDEEEYDEDLEEYDEEEYDEEEYYEEEYEEEEIDGAFEYAKLKPLLRSGDLVLMYPNPSQPPLCGMLLENDADPLIKFVMVRGKKKSDRLDHFLDNRMRNFRATIAPIMMFHSGFHKVVVRQLKKGVVLERATVLRAVEKVKDLPLSSEEVNAVRDVQASKGNQYCMAMIGVFILARIYCELGVLSCELSSVLPENLAEILKPHLEEEKLVSVCRLKPGHLLSSSKKVQHMRIPKGKQCAKLKDIHRTLDTGDLIMFCGVSKISTIIKRATKSKFSHVAMVVRIANSSYTLIWESAGNSAKLRDLDTGQVSAGVELVPLKTKLAGGWYSHAVVRRLNVCDEKRKDLVKLIEELRTENRGKKYQYNPSKLLGAILNINAHLKKIPTRFFCSQLVSMIYQNAGLLGKEHNYSNILPGDYSEDSETVLMSALGPEVYLEFSL